MDLDGKSELEFDEVELNKLYVVGMETVYFEGDRELKGKSSGSKSGKSRRNLDVNGAHVFDGNRALKGSSGSKSGKSRRNLDVNGAHVFDGDRELKGSSRFKSSKSRRALELHESELKFDEVELNELKFEGLFH